MRLRFETEGKIFAAQGSEGGYFSLEDTDWYPLPVARDPGRFTYALRVRTRKPLIPVAPGDQKVLRESGDFYEMKTEARVPKRVVPVVAGDYRTREVRAGKVAVRVHLFQDHGPLLDSVAERAAFFMDYFGRALGAHSEEALDIVEIPKDGRSIAGIGYPGMVLLAPYAMKRLQSGKPYGDRILAHEVGHQWFGLEGFVIMSGRDAWLYQSAAEYLSGLAVDALSSERGAGQSLAETLNDWRQEARKSAKAGSIEGAFLLTGFYGEWQENRLTGGRGPLVLHMLRGIAGDTVFFEILRRFLAEAAVTGTATTDLLQNVTGQVLGRDMGWFFDQWFRKGGIPKIRIAYRLEPLREGRWAIIGRARQPEDDTFKKMHIPVVLEMVDGAVEKQTIVQDAPATEFRLEVPGKPRRILVDPGRDTLADYELD